MNLISWLVYLKLLSSTQRSSDAFNGFITNILMALPSSHELLFFATKNSVEYIFGDSSFIFDFVEKILFLNNKIPQKNWNMKNTSSGTLQKSPVSQQHPFS